MILKKVNLGYIIIILIMIFPVTLSVVFKLIGLDIPSYLSISIILCLILSIVPVSFNYRKTSFTSLELSIYVFVFYVLSTALYSASEVAMKDKFINIVYSTLVPIFLINYFFSISNISNFDLDILHKKSSTTSFKILLVTFVMFLLDLRDESFPLNRWTLIGSGNPIWFGRFVGALLIIILTDSKFVNKFRKLVTVIIGLILLYKVGSRGPFLGVLIVLLLKKNSRVSKPKMLFLLSLLLLFLFVIMSYFEGRIFVTDDYSILERKHLIEQILSFNINNAFGYGLGSYNIVLNGVDERNYPHNIFLEILFENGIFGVLFFLLTLFFFIKSFKPNFLCLLCVFYFFNSLVSGDLASNNQLFICLFISSIVNRSSK